MTGPLVLGLDAAAPAAGRSSPTCTAGSSAGPAARAPIRSRTAGPPPPGRSAPPCGPHSPAWTPPRSRPAWSAWLGALVAEPGLDGLWPEVGLSVTPRTTSDLALAYTAGTGSPDGTVLIGGTGAVAAEVRDHTPVRLADGHGWLLGDLGSGQWLGREAVRLALAAVDAWPLTGTAAAAAEELTGRSAGDGLRAALLGAVYGEPPVRLARLAPLVLDAATAGEDEAQRLVDEAAAICWPPWRPSARPGRPGRWYWPAGCSARTPPWRTPSGRAWWHAGPPQRSAPRAAPPERPPGSPPAPSAPAPPPKTSTAPW
ncbi:hypothetical protein ACFQ1I_17270 [Kitasatospora arboriphila]